MHPSRILILLMIVELMACSDYGVSTIDTKTQPSLTFKYKSYDSYGVPYATGTLNLWIDNSRVTGTWRMDDGNTGILAGSIEDDSIQIDLYPGYADHNLILTGRVSGNSFAGQWVRYGWAILGRGTFVATM